mmetsp:Transcript_78810/g.225794  ORF Transcript_78810/g.225794 Transcript_78810/m.225794 type:complete len:207 (-) Transcript_78810:194-814(-)
MPGPPTSSPPWQSVSRQARGLGGRSAMGTSGFPRTTCVGSPRGSNDNKLAKPPGHPRPCRPSRSGTWGPPSAGARARGPRKARPRGSDAAPPRRRHRSPNRRRCCRRCRRCCRLVCCLGRCLPRGGTARRCHDLVQASVFGWLPEVRRPRRPPAAQRRWQRAQPAAPGAKARRRPRRPSGLRPPHRSSRRPTASARLRVAGPRGML